MDLHQLIARGSITGPYHRRAQLAEAAQRLQSARNSFRLWRRAGVSVRTSLRAAVRAFRNH